MNPETLEMDLALALSLPQSSDAPLNLKRLDADFSGKLSQIRFRSSYFRVQVCPTLPTA